MAMTTEEMKVKLIEWNPSWNVDRFTDQQISAIYNKERNRILAIVMGEDNLSQQKHTLL
jgi:hypothetical protein